MAARASDMLHAMPEVDFSGAREVLMALAVGPAVLFDGALSAEVLSEPQCDLCCLSPRFRMEKPGLRRASRGRHVLGSAVIHAALWMALWFFGGRGEWARDRFHDEEVVPVELAFGLGSDWRVAAATKTIAGESALDFEAQKLAQQLPQLPKVMAVEANEKPPDTMPVPATPAPAAIKPTPIPTPPVVVEATPPPGTRVIKAEEILRRIEREKRVVGPKERTGTRQKGGAGVKDPAQAIPSDPFAKADGRTVTAKSGLNAGALDGGLSTTARAYQMAALNHVRRYWSLPDTYKYDASLVTKVEIVVNMFGQIMSARIAQTSGDANFDGEVLVAVDDSNPFPDFQTDGLTRRTLVLSFRPREVK